MNAVTSPSPPAVLTIAGSDSGGGAGMQADLKTFSALGTFGTAALTCVTAQNPNGVYGISPVETDMVIQQIRAVCESFPIKAAKTGMLYSAEIIYAVADEDVREGIPVLVVDPVMIAASGARLLQADAVEAMAKALLPKARVITPNLHEAEILCGHSIGSTDELRAAARKIGDQYDLACVVKGGQLNGAEVMDVLYDEGEEHVFTSPRIDAAESHGAGCTFSAALTAYLAHGELMSDAVSKAKEFVYMAMLNAPTVGRHHPMDFFWNVQTAPQD